MSNSIICKANLWVATRMKGYKLEKIKKNTGNGEPVAFARKGSEIRQISSQLFMSI